MTKLKKISVFFFFFITHFLVSSQPDYGLPEITNYFDINNKYKSDQIWDIKQTKDGIMYFASTDHFIEYDGQIWREFIKNNGITFYSFDIDTNTRDFFIGAKNSLLSYKLKNGKYTKQEIFVPEFISSTWRTFYSDGLVYFFVNKKDIIVYSGNSIETLKHPENFDIVRGFKVNNDIFAVSETSLAKIKEKKVNILSQNIFEGDVRVILPYSDSSLLIGTKKGNFILYNLYTKEHTTFEIKNESLTNSNVYNGLKINDTTFAIATLKKGLFIINNEGIVDIVLNKETGLLSNAIYCAFLDKDKNIWLGTGMGVSQVHWNSSIKYLDKRNNIDDMISSMTIFQDKIIVSTSEGMYVDEIQKNSLYSFKPTNNQTTYSNNFLQILLNNSYYLFTTDYEGLTVFDEKINVNLKFDLYRASKMIRSPINKNRIYVTSYKELKALKIEENNGKIKLTVENSFFKLPYNIDNLYFDKNNNLWVCQDRSLFLVDFDEEENINKYKILFFDSSFGLPNTKINNVFEIADSIFVSTRQGIYKLTNPNDNINEFYFEKYNENAFKEIAEDVIFTIIEYGNYYYIQSDKAIYKIEKETLKTEKLYLGEVFDKSFAKMIYFNNHLWLFSKQKVMCIDPSNFVDKIQINTSLQIKSIKIGNRNNHYIYQNDSIVLIDKNNYKIINKIPSDENNLKISFSLPHYYFSEKTKYYLFNDNTSKWEAIETGNNLHLRHLSPGKYKLRIKAQSFHGIDSNEITIEFEINPKFYFSSIAIFIYITIFIIAVFTITYIRGKKIKRENAKLEDIVKQRTNQLEQQKEELMMQEKHLAEQKLLLRKESKKLDLANIELKQLSLVAKKTDNSVLILEKNGKIEWWNRGFTDLFASKINQFKDIAFRSAYKKIRPDIYKEIHAYSKDKGTLSYTNHEVFDNGEEIWYQTTINPVYDDNDELFKFVVIDINISDIKLAEDEILNHKIQLKQSNEMFSKISADLSITNERLKYITHFDKTNQLYATFLNYFFTKHTLNFEKEIEYVLFDRPQDMLSGDFIWRRKYNNKTLIAVGDSTGHKVRGTIISVLSISMLKETIFENFDLSINEIISIFYKKFNASLNSSDILKNEDSVDLALVLFDFENQKMEFTGGKIPLYLIRKEYQYNLYKYEADRIRISKVPDKFKNHVIDLKNNDKIYIATDGFINQFGKFGQKKYTSKKFRDFLISIQDKPFETHDKLFKNEIMNWKGNFDQIDDILIFGAKISLEQK